MFREYLTKIIDRKNLTQSEMSEMIGLSFSGEVSDSLGGGFGGGRGWLGGNPPPPLYFSPQKGLTRPPLPLSSLG